MENFNEDFSKTHASKNNLHYIMDHPKHGRVLNSGKLKSGLRRDPYISAKGNADRTAERHNKHDPERKYTVHKLHPGSDTNLHIVKVSGPKRTGYFAEDAPTNAVGGGNIAGAGVGPNGEPGVTPKWMKRYKDKNAAGAPKAGRKTFGMFLKGK